MLEHVADVQGYLRPRERASRSVVIDALVEAIAHVWGAANTTATPLFARWASNLLTLLYESRMTLAITTAIKASGTHRIAEFTTWPLLSQFNTNHPILNQYVTIRPDGYLSIAATAGENADYSFFLELDRSNEVQRNLAEKALCYRAIYAKGGFALRCGGEAEEYRGYVKICPRHL